MLIIITLGFTETFAIRSIFSRGIRPGDKIIIIQPNREDERAVKARNSLVDVIRKVSPEIVVLDEKINYADFFQSVKRIISILNSNKERPIYANLSGGMRLLIAEVLIALVLYNDSSEIEIFSEDGSNSVTFNSDIIKPLPLDDTDMKVLLNIAKSNATITGVASASGLSKSTVYRRFKKLEGLGLVKGGRLTEKGNLFVCSSES